MNAFLEFIDFQRLHFKLLVLFFDLLCLLGDDVEQVVEIVRDFRIAFRHRIDLIRRQLHGHHSSLHLYIRNSSSCGIQIPLKFMKKSPYFRET